MNTIFFKIFIYPRCILILLQRRIQWPRKIKMKIFYTPFSATKPNIDLLTNTNFKVMVDEFVWVCRLYILMVTHFVYAVQSVEVRYFV